MKKRSANLFEGLKTRPASATLRARVLQAARQEVRPEANTLVNQLWGSRLLRYGWMAVATLLLAFNITLDLTGVLKAPAKKQSMGTELEFEADLRRVVVLAQIRPDGTLTYGTALDQLARTGLLIVTPDREGGST